MVNLKVEVELVEDSANLEPLANIGTRLANFNMTILRFLMEDLEDKLQMDQETILLNQIAKIGQITNFAVELSVDTLTTFQEQKISPQILKSISA